VQAGDDNVLHYIIYIYVRYKYLILYLCECSEDAESSSFGYLRTRQIFRWTPLTARDFTVDACKAFEIQKIV